MEIVSRQWFSKKNFFKTMVLLSKKHKFYKVILTHTVDTLFPSLAFLSIISALLTFLYKIAGLNSLG